MSDLMSRLFEESQDNPNCLYWQAAERIAELEAGNTALVRVSLSQQKQIEAAEAVLEAIAAEADEWSTDYYDARDCAKAIDEILAKRKG